jgi:hypothetical protein
MLLSLLAWVCTNNYLLNKSTGRVHRLKKLSGPDFPSVT